MKRSLLSLLRNTLCLFALLLVTNVSKASHIVGADLYYTWITGNTYKITFVAYGDCGPASASAFSQLPTGAPRVCVFDGTTNITTLTLAIQPPSAGVEITPVCPADSLNTQCHSATSTYPGIKKFVYSINYTVPYASANWKFIFTGAMGSTSAGRAAALTNITGGSIMGLTATLNNLPGPNSNPILTILPVPFFCNGQDDNYNPGAVDADGDSLRFALVAPTNYTGSGCISSPPSCTYVVPTPAYPYSATTPIHTGSATVSFDPATGQISFVPDMTQRAVVVYTISEYRNGVLVGSMQREMSFTIINCTTPPPNGYMGSATNGTVDDSTHYHICAENGPFTINMGVTSPSPTLNITVTNTGVPPGCTFTVLNNGTPNPLVSVNWTSTGTTPGIYTFFVNFRDDACPINGQQTKAFTISIYPVPIINYTVISAASCSMGALVSLNPGGAGTPWTVRYVNGAGVSFDSVLGVTTAYVDTFTSGNDTLVIYNAGSEICNYRLAMPIAPPSFVTINATPANPTYCGLNDGSITIGGLRPLEADTLYYTYNGVPQPGLPIFSSSAGTYVLTNLCAGSYTNIYVRYGICISNTLGPVILTTPPFTISRLEYHSPSACGFNDGYIIVRGIHPGQFDTLKYTLNGVPQTPVTSYVVGDSTITLINLGAGTYSNFVVNTTGACPNAPNCASNSLGPITLVDTPIVAAFDTVIHLGCEGDTVFFTNLSTPTSTLAPLFFRWYFGDGGTDTSRNPMHVYYHTGTAPYTIKLIITNTHCVDSVMASIVLPEKVNANFYSNAGAYICQGTQVNFRDTSTGIGLTWLWNFGDGATSTGKDPSHIYPNTGTYVVTLISTDNVPCKDTISQTVIVDSTSEVSLFASDTVLCRGNAVTFLGTYTDIGLTGVTWNFGDGTGYTNANPIQHSFDVSGNITVTMTVTYRACATVTTTRNLRIYENPNIYIGPDTAMCPGATAIEVKDLTNGPSSGVTWLWSTGETTSAIWVDKPGYYSATVTKDGCIGSDTMWVANDCYMNFPNIFTPNGDGVNDYFFPRSILSRGLTSFSMSIYNRWGQLIYETKNTEGLGWDGKFNNEAQPQGVFVYVIEATFKDGQKLHKQGNVTLIR